MSLITGLVSYWKLENVSDSQGSNTLTNNNGTTFTAGKLNNAATFDGTGLQSLSNAGAVLAAGDYSVSLWVKLTDTVDDQFLIANSSRFQITVSSAGVFQVLCNVGGVTRTFNSTTVPASGWTHLALTVSSGAQVLYVNGVSESSGVFVGALNTSTPFVLGDSSVNGGVGLVSGQLDEVAVANRVWTSGEVTQIFNGGSPLPYESWGGAPVPPANIRRAG